VAWYNRYMESLNTSDTIQLAIAITTLLAVVAAFIAPYIIEKWKFTYRTPKLGVGFNFAPPDCHQTQMKGHDINFPVYYFRFVVENVGKIQAEACEVLLEKVLRENSAGEMIEFENFTPVNLKWSGIRDPIEKTIQPGRKIFCDLGRIHHPDYKYKSIYRNITDEEQRTNNFAFELPELYYSQWDCLTPGKYDLIITIYSKNASKVTRNFRLSWSGIWKDETSNMFNEIVIR
jgi:hypothetical protein